MLSELIKLPESKTLEFKENIKSPLKILKTVIAFANTAGGEVVIGVRDKDRDIVGVPNVLREEERISNLIADSIAPMMIPDIDIVNHEKKELIVIHVPYLVGPYYLKKANMPHGVFIRLGSTNRQADSQTIANIQRLAKNISFDELPCPNASVDEMDDTYIKKVLSKKLDKKHYRSLGIIVPQGRTEFASYGGILLFGKDRLKLLPDSLIRCVCFAGTSRSEIIDQKDIDSPLVSAVDEAIVFISRHSNLRAVFTGSAQRLDIPQFPADAVREAVVNAIVHCDYSMKGSSIQIAVFADRVEIINPGGLAFGQTMKHALSGVSRMRNRLIGRIFRELKIIEQLGTGLLRILEEYRAYPQCEPKFEDLNTHFKIILPQTTSSSKPTKIWERQLIAILADNKKLSAKEIAALWSVSDRTARTRLTVMQKQGLIQRHAKSTNDPDTTYSIRNGN